MREVLTIAPTTAVPTHSIAISGEHWLDDLRLSDIEERFVWHVCGKRGAAVRPDFNWNKTPA